MLTNITKARSRDESGFSLIEVVFAMAFLAIALLALGELAAVATNQNALCRTGSVSVSVAQGVVEELRAKFNARLADPAADLSDLTAGNHGPVSVSLPSYGTYVVYQVRWTVTEVSTTEKTVSVSVQRQNGSLTRQTVVITSDFAP